jgi:hypothetical protein
MAMEVAANSENRFPDQNGVMDLRALIDDAAEDANNQLAHTH